MVPDPRGERRARLLGLLTRHKATCIAVSHLPNVRYLSGFTGSNAILLVTARASILFTDPRYDIQARQESDCAVHVVKGPLWPEVAKEARRRRVAHVALESDKVSHDDWRRAASLFGRGIRLKPVKGLVEKLRTVKSAGEIEAIRRSVRLNSQAWLAALASVHPGMSERALAAEIDHQMRLLGAEGPAFETIVASGPRSALPHARPTAGLLGFNRLVLVDMGACLDGYSSDMTRVFHLGRPGARARGLHAAVLEAQLAALDAVRPGATCVEVDGAARKVLKKRKLDALFTHSTGHGLGLEIHESPRIGAKENTPLEPGMVITIEPGAYIEGFGGVRIEDTVRVTETGVEVLTPTSKELLVLAS